MPSETAKKVVKPSGNSAHVYVPKHWAGDIVRVERQAASCPELFQDAREDAEVFVEYLDEEDEQQMLEATIQRHTLNLRENNDSTYTIYLEDDDGTEYSIEATLPEGSTEWDQEIPLKVEDNKSLTDEDEGVIMEELSWETIGTVDGFAVKRSVSQQSDA